MTFGEQLQQKYGKGYLSYSSVKLALQDMRLFEMKMRGQLKMESPALSFGKLYDCLLLTPDAFDAQFVVADDTDIIKEIGGKAPKRTKLYAEWKESLKQEGKETVSPEDITKAKEMIERLYDTGVQETSLKGDAQYEFNDYIGDVPVRGFLDILGDGYITDSKTTQKIGKFRWSVRDFGYDIQAYMYTQVLGIDDFRWVAQEKAYPYAVGLYFASEQTLENGKNKFDRAVARIREYLDGDIKSTSYYETDYI